MGLGYWVESDYGLVELLPIQPGKAQIKSVGKAQPGKLAGEIILIINPDGEWVIQRADFHQFYQEEERASIESWAPSFLRDWIKAHPNLVERALKGAFDKEMALLDSQLRHHQAEIDRLSQERAKLRATYKGL